MLQRLRVLPTPAATADAQADERALAAAVEKSIADLDAATFAFGDELTGATGDIVGRTANCIERALAHHRRERERLGKELAAVKRQLAEHTLCEQVLAAATESLADPRATEDGDDA